MHSHRRGSRMTLTIEPEPLAQMRERGGTWYAYQNQDMSHSDLGRVAFLQVGEQCTHQTPPPHYPDTRSVGFGWRYLRVGPVDLENGAVADETADPPGEAPE